MLGNLSPLSALSTKTLPWGEGEAPRVLLSRSLRPHISWSLARPDRPYSISTFAAEWRSRRERSKETAAGLTLTYSLRLDGEFLGTGESNPNEEGWSSAFSALTCSDRKTMRNPTRKRKKWKGNSKRNLRESGKRWRSSI
jgi:hypothetical protein